MLTGINIYLRIQYISTWMMALGTFIIVAIDTSFGKRILIMKVKTKAIIKILSRYFDFNA